MVTTLLVSSALIFFFFGFNAEPFLGPERAGFTVHALIDRGTKSFCGSAMVYGLNHFTGFMWEQYANGTFFTLGRTRKTSPAVATITATATPEADQFDASGDRTAEDKAWNDSDNSYQNKSKIEQSDRVPRGEHRPEPVPPPIAMEQASEGHDHSKPLSTARGMNILSSHLNDTLLNRALDRTPPEYAVDCPSRTDLNAFLTKYDFSVFVFCLLIPSVVLYFMNKGAKKRMKKTMRQAANESKMSGFVPPYASDIMMVPSFHSQEAGQDKLIAEKLDDILGCMRSSQNVADRRPSPEQQHHYHQPPQRDAVPAELESLRKIIHSVISDQAARVQDLEILRRGQERIEGEISNLRAIEERVNKKFDENIRQLEKSIQQDQAINVAGKEKVTSQLDALEQDLDLLRYGQERIERQMTDFKAAEEHTNKLFDEHTSELRRLPEQGQIPNVGITEDLNLRLGALEQHTEGLVDLIEHIQNDVFSSDELHKLVDILNDDMKKKLDDRDNAMDAKLKQYNGTIDALHERVETSGHDINTRLKLVEQVQAQKQTKLSSDFVDKPHDLDERVKRDIASSLSSSSEFASELHELGKRVKELQQRTELSLNMTDTLTYKVNEMIYHNNAPPDENLRDDIFSLKGRIDRLENDHQDVDAFQRTSNLRSDDISILKEKMIKVETNQQDFSASLNTQRNEDINILNARIDKIKSEQQTIETKLNAQGNDISTLKEEIEKTESNHQNIGALQQTYGNDIYMLNGRITAVESNQQDARLLQQVLATHDDGISSLQQTVNGYSDDITILHGRIRAAEGNQEDISTKLNVNGDSIDKLNKSMQKVASDALVNTGEIEEVKESWVSSEKEIWRQINNNEESFTEKAKQLEVYLLKRFHEDIQGIKSRLCLIETSSAGENLQKYKNLNPHLVGEEEQQTQIQIQDLSENFAEIKASIESLAQMPHLEEKNELVHKMDGLNKDLTAVRKEAEEIQIQVGLLSMQVQDSLISDEDPELVMTPIIKRVRDLEMIVMKLGYQTQAYQIQDESASIVDRARAQRLFQSAVSLENGHGQPSAGSGPQYTARGSTTIDEILGEANQEIDFVEQCIRVNNDELQSTGTPQTRENFEKIPEDLPMYEADFPRESSQPLENHGQLVDTDQGERMNTVEESQFGMESAFQNEHEWGDQNDLYEDWKRLEPIREFLKEE